MNNQEKFTTWSNKLKVRKANSQITSLYTVIFSTYILFSSRVYFAFCFLVIFDFVFFEIENMYSDTHLTMWVGGK